jgi:hypothetical protein
MKRVTSPCAAPPGLSPITQGPIGDNETWCTGFNNDNFRAAFDSPEQDQAGVQYQKRFGSAHSAGWFVSWCDGHVSMETFDIDKQVHRGNANRADEGNPFNDGRRL